VDAAPRAGAAPGQVLFVPEAEEAVAAVTREARPGDLCLVLGAGDVWKAAREIHTRLAGRDDVEGE
jgi:UDP-N-acetylmuramate-alanine ligase